MIRQVTLSLAGCLLAGALFISCQKESNETAQQPEAVSQDVLQAISNKGFSTAGVRKIEGGYLVEGDILLDEEDLASTPTSPNLRIAEVEQYRTNNLVTALPRVITVRVSGLSQAFIDGTDLAISRYNALGLRITFQRVTSGTANITIQGFYQGPSGGFITLGSAGFPTSSGNPYNTIRMNTHPQAYGSNPNVNYVGSVIQHEIGHCIGFRHTDYMNRAYSCGSGGNEGSAGVGAVHIPGTPTGSDAASWMLACSNGGNRTFNANDRVALNYLY
ncbi:M57 family metalloprotease [Chitinophaga japonensis]|uniref:Dual-action HEIGH metallo-peptidase n=1 Tax=Chitinophaga japonensis TaxID=104662 RepID=A0A562T5W3_CHIJA|nr:M57 family metalloprotease [Chitinophaga japonensis]TWI88915.1 dual-action HEIGH metallo-peptidase [Chitinophaga japonensis]